MTHQLTINQTLDNLICSTSRTLHSSAFPGNSNNKITFHIRAFNVLTRRNCWCYVNNPSIAVFLAFVFINLFHLLPSCSGTALRAELVYSSLSNQISPSNEQALNVESSLAWKNFGLVSLPMKRGPNPDETGSHREGDIKEAVDTQKYDGSSSSNRLRRSVTSYDYKRWPNGVIPYDLDSTYTAFQRNLLRRAMDGIEEHTCVKFVERTSEADYIYVEAQDGCSSYVGKRGGRQVVSLQAWTCLSKIGVMMHELMHVVGFYHEHTRLDRDEFIRIDWPNIQGGREVNFKQREPGSIDNQGLGYDYGSVMHYSAYAFSKDAHIPTLLPTQNKVPLDILGQRDRLSDLDIRKINALYKCNGHASIDPPKPLLLGRPMTPPVKSESPPPKPYFIPNKHVLSVDPRRSLLTPSSYFYPLSSSMLSKNSNNSPCLPGFEPDAFISTASGELLLIQNDHAWLVDASRQLRDVGSLQQHFAHAPKTIDGAFSWSNEFTFLFSGGYYWKYRGATLLNGYPQPIEAGFPGLPTTSLDAAFRWGEKIIFIKGERYWKLHPYVDSSIRGPFSVHDTAIPMPVEAGFQEPSTRATYAFVQGFVFKLNTYALQAELDSRQPLSSWLRCDKLLTSV